MKNPLINLYYHIFILKITNHLTYDDRFFKKPFVSLRFYRRIMMNVISFMNFNNVP